MAKAARPPRQSNTYPFIDPERFSGTLLDHIVLVTGAGRGIGKGIALAFARAGANVACVSRTKREIDDVVQEISHSGLPQAIAVSADVSSLEEIAMAVKSIKQKFGHIDILVNNAGADRIGSMLHEADFQAWWRVFEVNMMGPSALVHQLLPGMLSRNKGVIINIGSRNAVANFPYMTAYSASKTALLRFHQCLALELRGTNVTTFYVQPGDVSTSLMDGTYNPAEAATDAGLQRMVTQMQTAMHAGDESDSVWLAGNTCVMLAADKNVHSLSGIYLDANQDLSEVLEEVNKGKNGAIRKKNLYTLKVDIL
ncbi:hypothetical protein F5883DRAFT_497671 [Diaporthe sp. PMI_573]|jgi:NAD(P)-dependent dehydrogenase (short-subunit alcohol dehydrogenase family)|nr:hypothetical protein F5883DRAFT_497671 [Diaporthaceae sp. PMI_573]